MSATLMMCDLGADRADPDASDLRGCPRPMPIADRRTRPRRCGGIPSRMLPATDPSLGKWSTHVFAWLTVFWPTLTDRLCADLRIETGVIRAIGGMIDSQSVETSRGGAIGPDGESRSKAARAASGRGHVGTVVARAGHARQWPSSRPVAGAELGPGEANRSRRRGTGDGAKKASTVTLVARAPAAARSWRC